MFKDVVRKYHAVLFGPTRELRDVFYAVERSFGVAFLVASDDLRGKIYPGIILLGYSLGLQNVGFSTTHFKYSIVP